MADGLFRFQQGAGQFYYGQHSQQSNHHRHLPQRASSPVSSGRIGFNTDTPSPSRSPGPQSPARNPYAMYSQNHQQHGQHVMMNGQGHRGFMQMNMSKQYQQSQSQHHQGHPHQQHQDHTGHSGHGNNFGGHQHTISSGGLSNATPHFTPSHLQNGTPGSSHSGMNKPPNEHWREQLELCQRAREMTTPHAHARNHPSVKQNLSASTTNGLTKEPEKEERNRAISGLDDGTQKQKQVWSTLDFGGQNLKTIAPSLFDYRFLTKLYLNYNKLSRLPPAIGRLRSLALLDASLNNLTELPPQVGMLSNLKQFFLFDNQLTTLPYEMGALYQLETLGIEGNPLDDNLKSIIMERGTQELIKELREHAEVPEPPAEDRAWIYVDMETSESATDKFTALTYNTLCAYYATQSQYGYTPSGALNWDHRKQVILDELRAHNSDIMCLQEVDSESFHDFFRSQLALNDYKGVFWPRSRARTMAEKEAKQVDGCATFYKNSKYILLDKQLIDFGNIAINRPDMKGEHDIFNRVMPKDNIAVVTFLENRYTGSRLIVVNAYIYWDPAFRDVKVVQAAILMEQLTKLAEKYAKWPACQDKTLYKFSNGDKEEENGVEEPNQEPAPSLEYSSGAQIPLVLSGDFNSTLDSGVYDLIAHGTLSNSHSDFMNRKYGNLTRDGMTHPFSLKSSYSSIGELSFTNYTPGFAGVIDYIWYSTNTLTVTALLGEVDKNYLERVPGFPNYHFPSDHLALLGEFALKPRKDMKKLEAADFPQRDRRS